MASPLHAAWYADRALQRTVAVVENVRLARDTFRVRVRAPEIAERIVPGQFLMVRLAGCNDPLIGRPFALYDTTLDEQGRPDGLDVVYLVKGKLTTRLASVLPGQELDIWGPLGNGFAPTPTDHLFMVAGGIGQTPFLALARERLGLRPYGESASCAESLRESASGDESNAPAAGRSVPTPMPPSRVTFCYGARSAEYMAGVEDFERLGINVRLATDDGSRGHHGFVTDVLRDALRDAPADRRIVCCGPEPMMEAVSRIAAETSTPCEVSLETPMACGIGVCFTCVARVRDDGDGWDYRRTCVEGPVFDAARIEW